MADPADAPKAIEIGSQIAGRYVVEALLGRGGMGAVYRVVDRVLGERVALKALAFAESEGSEVERFLREVRLARRITHKNVARTFDVGVEGKIHYLTMELVEGPSLRQLIRKLGKIPLQDALLIAAQVADGLAAAHEVGIVHRDLKPSNVLVADKGRAVIVDFGIARAMGEDQSLTRGAIGTPAYMAPEQFSGKAVSEHADLYALGLVLHEMVTGELPSWGGQPGDLLARLTDASPPALAIRESSPALGALIERLLAPDPARRPGRARELAEALRALAGGEPAKSPGEPTVHVGPSVPALDTESERFSSTLPAPVTPFAPLPDTKRALAVLAFKERGGVEPGLGSDLCDELIDTLARVRGLRIASSRAVARFGADASPEVVGKELNVDFIVEGTVQKRESVLRVTIRLVEVSGGVQVWSQRFEGRLEDVVELEEQIAQRIAEALRLELEIVTDRGTAPAHAIELYWTGRRKMRELDILGEDGAPALLERAVGMAPRFRPAVAAAALAFVKRSFAASVDDPDDVQLQAEQWVSRALREAEDLPEAQLAAGALAAQRGDYVKAAGHLRSAVAIAPTYAEAQEYLGHLQCEAGLPAEGVRRLMQALALDPLLRVAPADLARHHLLHGRLEEYRRYRDEVERRTGGRGAVIAQLDLRAASWRRDWDAVRQVRERIRDVAIFSARFLIYCADYILEPEVDEQSAKNLTQHRADVLAPRLATFAHQLMAEAFGVRDQAAHCLEQIGLATDCALVDLEWIENCPALACVRDTPEFAELAYRVKIRTSAIWSLSV